MVAHTVARNLKDLRDAPAGTRSAIEFIGLETVDDAIRGALGGVEAPRAAREMEPA